MQVFSALPEGTWTFAVRATDSAGNLQTAAPANVSWTVALTAPYAALAASGSTPDPVSTSGVISFSFLSLVPAVCLLFQTTQDSEVVCTLPGLDRMLHLP